ncbi:hypothetical protein C8R48DRAFT_668288 [Suillus tomentosus]|nr:hypothetical protein C8R48DRAFT_668288 [Suillus tomentosus]
MSLLPINLDQQAVYRDGRNPTFWCSIGVLYFQINQFRDTLDAYSRAIHINPYISEIWFDLGSPYESCNNQISDAIYAYARASELDPGNHVISQCLQLLKNAQATGGCAPNCLCQHRGSPPGLTGPPLLLQSTSTCPPIFQPQSSSSNMAIPFSTTTFRPPSSPPLPMASLIFTGKQLKHGHTLSDYNIQTALVVMQLMLTPMTSKPQYWVTVSSSPSLAPFKWDKIGGLKDSI